jgi:hypothetical protein
MADLMSTGNEILPQKCCKGLRIDFIGLNFGIGDGFEILGVCQDKFDALSFQEIIEPIPARRRLDNGDMGSGE